MRPPIKRGSISLKAGDFSLDLSGLKMLQANLDKQGKMHSEVGIFRSKASRQNTQGHNLSNAEIGAVHEFGSQSRNVPRRSFLWVPLITQLRKRLAKIGDDVFKALSEDKSLKPAYQKLGLEAEAVVDGGFASNGYGRWQGWTGMDKKSTRYGTRITNAARRAVGAEGLIGPIRMSILVRTAQLRRSISSRVSNK